MAGVRQHVLPKFLQRGFASHWDGDEAFVFVFRKGAAPFNSNVTHVGVERHFYSADGDDSVDDAITDAEGPYSEQVSEWKAKPGRLAESALASEMIAHFETRTRSLRQNFLSVGGTLIDALIRALEDPVVLTPLLKQHIRAEPELVANALSGIPQASLPPRDALLELLMRDEVLDQLVPAMIAADPGLFEKMRNEVAGGLKDAAKSGHIKALKQSIAPPIKALRYSELEYEIRAFDQDQPLPLGDSILVFEVEGERRFKPFCEKDDRLLAVYLPISRNRLVVGTVGEFRPSLPELPLAIAQCSLEYFVAAEDTEFERQLHREIGNSAHLLAKQEIQSLISNLVAIKASD